MPHRNKYLLMSEIHFVRGWGNEQWWEFVDEPGHVIKGIITDRFDIPFDLFHVTTHADKILKDGWIRHIAKGKGGLGKGTSRGHHGVSFTSSLDDARLIQREVLRLGFLAHGGDFIDSIYRFANEDKQIAGGWAFEDIDFARDEAVDRFNWLLQREAKYSVSGHIMDAMRTYRTYRGSRVDTLKDPIIFGDLEDFDHVVPENTLILICYRDDIPPDVVVREPLGEFMHEIMVHCDMPVRNTIL